MIKNSNIRVMITLPKNLVDLMDKLISDINSDINLKVTRSEFIESAIELMIETSLAKTKVNK